MKKLKYFYWEGDPKELSQEQIRYCLHIAECDSRDYYMLSLQERKNLQHDISILSSLLKKL